MLNSAISNGVDIVNNERIIDIVSTYSVEHLVVLDMYYALEKLNESIEDESKLMSEMDTIRKETATKIGVQNYLACQKILVIDGLVEQFGVGFFQTLNGVSSANYAITDYGKQVYTLINSFDSSIDISMTRT